MEKTSKTIFRRIVRALRFEKAVYKEVVNDPAATKQAILVPLVMEALIFVIIVIAAIPLAIIATPADLPSVIMGITAVYGIFALFLFVPFFIWVPLLFAVGRFAGVKTLQMKQVLRVTGYAFSPMFMFAFFMVATMYSAGLTCCPVISTFVFLAGIVVVALLLLINSVIAFREATDVTIGVSVMSNFSALVIFGLILGALVVPFGLAVLELLKNVL